MTTDLRSERPAWAREPGWEQFPLDTCIAIKTILDARDEATNRKLDEVLSILRGLEGKR